MAKNTTKRPRRLGRGLSSLLSQQVEVVPPVSQLPSDGAGRASGTGEGAGGAAGGLSGGLSGGRDVGRGVPPDGSEADVRVVYLRIDSIAPNPHQPRQSFDEQSLRGLADSIKTAGLMQPIIVRRGRADEPAPYQIVAGERRWRAAGIAGLAEVPAIVHQLEDAQLAEWALIENLQREDLNPIERAMAFDRLIGQFKLTHGQVAQRVGVDRSTISNSIRLLQLDKSIQDLVAKGLLSNGHAKALTSADPSIQVDLAKRAIRQEWSVRRLEEAVRKLTQSPITMVDPPVKARSPHLSDLENQIGQQLQTKVRIRPGRRRGTGTLAIEFFDIDQFDALLARLGVKTE